MYKMLFVAHTHTKHLVFKTVILFNRLLVFEVFPFSVTNKTHTTVYFVVV